VAQDVLAACKAKFAPRHVLDALKARRQAGIALVIKPGMPEWHRWAEHFARHEPVQRKLMDRYGSWQVPSRWPPGRAGEGAQEVRA
jgi:hypothetical protein